MNQPHAVAEEATERRTSVFRHIDRVTRGDDRDRTGVIRVKNLTKDYGHGRGIFDVSLDVDRGEVFGFLGPNGAGKTTTIRHLMGFSAPQSGEASILGMNCWSSASRILRHIGYLPGEPALPEGLTGMQFIRFMQGLRGSHDEQRLNRLLDVFELDPTGRTKRMSLGNKRKLAVVTAFMSDPEILLLDEPTSGLDPVMQARFIEFVTSEKARGKTILLSSHMFSEVEAICDRIAIIKDGQIVSTVRTADIRHPDVQTYQIQFADPAGFERCVHDWSRAVVWSDQNTLSVHVSIDTSGTNGLIGWLSTRTVASFKQIKFTLEEYFLHFYDTNERQGHHEVTD